MKATRYHVVLTIAAAILCVPVGGRTASVPGGEKPLSIGRPHPALVGIDRLRARILRRGDYPSINSLDWAQLHAKVIDKLEKADMTLNSEVTDGTLNDPELRIYIDLLKIEDLQRDVFRIQTSLARAVCLAQEPDPVFKAELWQVTPAMQVVPAEDLPAAVTNGVLEQVGAFILAWQTSNLQHRQPPAEGTVEAEAPAAAEKQLGPDAKTPAAEYKYIASKSSTVFHKPDCRWAKNISAENLVGYNTRDDAIKDGKRPCQWCKP
jgi:micrococcal nuclease